MICVFNNNKILLLIVTSSVFLYLINYYELPEEAHIIRGQRETYDLLVDYKGFNFIINPRICWKIVSDPFVLVAVPSSPENLDYRKTIRNTWGRWDDNMKVVFFLGIPEFDFENLTREVRVESHLFGDIVQGNFIDSYRNMTYKHLMVLKWAKYYCLQANFVVKVDDDTIVNLPRLYNLLENKEWGENGVMTCYTQPNSSVERFYGAWNISLKEYPKERYPRYCSGFFVIYSRDVVLKLLEASQMVPYFFVDDVYVTGLLAKKINIRPIRLNTTFVSLNMSKWLLEDQSRLRGGPFIIGPIVQDWRDIRKTWLALQRYNFKTANKNSVKLNNSLANSVNQSSDLMTKKSIQSVL